MSLIAFIKSLLGKRVRENQTLENTNENVEQKAKDTMQNDNDKNEGNEETEESLDQSVYDDDPKATQEDDMEEDLALLDEEDDLW